MKQTKISIKVEGTTPLLMNRFRDTQIEGKIKRRTGSMSDEELKEKLYLYDDKPHIPSVYFRNSIVEASKQFKIVGKGKATYSKLVASTIEVNPEMILINGSYESFRIASVNPSTKGRMMITRPRFNKWDAEFTLILNDDGVPPEVMNEILEQAGRYVGIGDWRPQTKGVFGKFMITLFKEVEE